MAIKRTLALTFAFVGITLAVFSLTVFQTITRNVVGENLNSKLVSILGILFMVIAVLIERYEIKKK